MTNQVRYWAIVPAAGVGKRMQADRPKQYLPLANTCVLEQTLCRLLSVVNPEQDQDNSAATSLLFTAVVVAITTGDPYWPELAVSNEARIITAAGGKERADSVLSGLSAIQTQAAADDWVLVHDAARPCITQADIHKLILQLKDDPVGGILAWPCHDTLKQVTTEKIHASVDRSTIWRALTPQMFRYQLLKDALMQSVGNPAITDEASALELLGYQPNVVEGRPDNIKITRPEDLGLANFYLEQQ